MLFCFYLIADRTKPKTNIVNMERKITIIVLSYFVLQIIIATTWARPASTNTQQNNIVEEEKKKLRKFLSALSGNIRPGMISNMKINSIENSKKQQGYKISLEVPKVTTNTGIKSSSIVVPDLDDHTNKLEEMLPSSTELSLGSLDLFVPIKGRRRPFRPIIKCYKCVINVG